MAWRKIFGCGRSEFDFKMSLPRDDYQKRFCKHYACRGNIHAPVSNGFFEKYRRSALCQRS
jgi:hypothetical protein